MTFTKVGKDYLKFNIPVYKSTRLQLSSNWSAPEWTRIPFDSVIFDDLDTFASNENGIIIPDGISRIWIYNGALYEGGSRNDMEHSININGGKVAGNEVRGAYTPSMAFSSGPIDVTGGDLITASIGKSRNGDMISGRLTYLCVDFIVTI